MRYLTAIALLCLAALAEASTNGTVHPPAGGNLEIVDEPGVEAVSLIEHFPYRNLISWEIKVRNGRCDTVMGLCVGGPNDSQGCMTQSECWGPLTFTRGSAQYSDEDGNVMAQEALTTARFDEIARVWGRGVNYVKLARLGFCNADSAKLCGKAGGDDKQSCDPDGTIGNAACDPRPGPGFVPGGVDLGIPFPLESIPHNAVPASSEMAICFAEFGNTTTQCPNPLQVVDVVLDEYHAQESYIYPLGNPDNVLCVDTNNDPTGETPTLFMGAGAGHEINTNHRFARNQRYAYDVGVRCGNSDRKNIGNTNSDWYIHRQPVLAQAAGTVVAFEGGHPENTSPPDNISDGVGKCKTRRCDGLTVDTCVDDPDPTKAVFPGSGNQLVLRHNNSEERTNYTHMDPGSNDGFPCGSVVNQGQKIGEVGNVGNSSAPHIHISTLTSDGPEDQDLGIDTTNWPNYWTNVEFASAVTLPQDPNNPFPPQSHRPRRQLDVGMPTQPFDLEWGILPPPVPLLPNPVVGANEQEPNDVLAQHNSLAIPATVSGILENGDVGDLAVRGDAIEDIYRLDLSAADDLRIDLDASASGENLDVYALTEDLRVINPTREGTSPGGVERMCLDIPAGAYYVMVTNFDLTTSQPAEYQMSVVSDPQTIDVEIEGGATSVEVDANCEASIGFSITLHDNCCLDEDNLNLVIIPTIVTNNATADAAVIDSIQAQGERDIVVTGHVPVSNLTSCPVVLRIDAVAQDCAGNLVHTSVDGGEDTIEVLDTLPPEVTSSVALARLWPPEHDLIDVGFQRSATDNCDADVAQSLTTEVWGDESETLVVGIGPFAPDARDLDAALRLRAERQGLWDGRVYLETTDAVDACGNRGFDCSTVGVARDLSESSELQLSTQEVGAMQFCEANAGAAPPWFHQHGLAAEQGPKQ